METAHIGYPPQAIALFILFIVGCLAVDLYAHRKDKPVSLKSALIWSGVWVGLSMAFYGYLYVAYSSEFAALFLTGWALEKVLSVDNLMVFVAIFAAFSIPEGLRHRVLFYGVLAAIVLRLVFVLAGAWLYALGPWVEYVFALIIAWTAVKMLQAGDDAEITDYSDHWSVRYTKKIFPVWPKLHGHDFFVSGKTVETLSALPENSGVQVERGKARYATPLFLCLVMVNVADIVFSFDSVPAVIAVTKEPLLVYSAMIFAILGLRQLYFVLAALQKFMKYLEQAVIVLLFFIAAKLCVSAAYHQGLISFTIDPNISLLIVISVLAIGVIASLMFPPKDDEAA